MSSVSSENIYIVGFMGTGKSTIGTELAKIMGRPFIDTDRLIEKQEGRRISEIFENEGEEYFRQKEQEVIHQLSQENHKVIATGGGIVVNPGVIELMQSTGLVVRLFAPKKTLMRRLVRTDRRPLLSSESKEESLAKAKQLMRERAELYDRILVTMKTANDTPLLAARKIFNFIKNHRSPLHELNHYKIKI